MTASDHLRPAHTGWILDRVSGYQVLACSRCGFTHLVPVPSRDEVRRVYERDYYSVVKPDYFDRYVAPSLDWWRRQYTRQLHLIERFAFSRLLEIGCGWGVFLECARDRGWDVLGIEPAAAPAAYCKSRGLPVIRGLFEDLPDRELGSFGAVYLDQVLEHMTDPAGILRRVHSLLTPGGVVGIVVPNDYNPLQNLLRKCGFPPYWVVPPYHVNYFTFDSLAALLRACGFDVVYRSATFPMEVFVFFGLDYVRDPDVGTRAHEMRVRFEEFALRERGMLDRFYEALAREGLGREIVMLGRRHA